MKPDSNNGLPVERGRRIEWQPAQRHALGPSVKIALLRSGLARRPDQPSLHYQLGVELQNAGSYLPAVDAFRQAIDLAPRFADAYTGLGDVLSKLSRNKEAIVVYRKAVEIEPAHAPAHCGLGMALLKGGDGQAALEVLTDAVALRPSFYEPRIERARVLFRKGSFRRALEDCDVCLQMKPGDPQALALKALSFKACGEESAARYLTDTDDLLEVSKPSCPGGFEDVHDLNRSLIGEIKHHESLAYEPVGKATRGGLQTRVFESGKGRAIALLEQVIQNALDQYCGSLPSGHPVTVGRPMTASLNMMGVVLQAGGYQDPHMHPYGWLSGVYYVRVPAGSREAPRDQSGWIEFHRPPTSYGRDVDVEVTLVRPEEGMLIIFPSYFFHRTLPTSTDQERISIAFDVVPIEPGGSHESF